MMKLMTRTLGEIDATQIPESLRSVSGIAASVGTEEADRYQAVSWRIGQQNRGIVLISNIYCSDPEAAAELVAIRFLLFKRNVFKYDIFTGKGISLEMSQPVIKKVYRRKTTKNHLIPFAHFMTSNLTGVALGNTPKNDEYLPTFETEGLVLDIIDSRDKPEYDVLDTPAAGKIRLTKHAIDQYEERQHSGDAKNPIASLIGRLKHPELARQALPDKTVRHKLKKYGTVDNLEVWGHHSSQMHFLVVREKNKEIGTLVTVYRRHQEFAGQ